MFPWRKVATGTDTHTRGIEPTYALIIAHCPNASINPDTGEPVTKQVVYDTLESRCYDIDPEEQNKKLKNKVLLKF